MAENQSKATPAKVLFLFTLLFAGVTAAAWRETSQGTSLETIDYPTALGDEQRCPVALLQQGAIFPAILDGQKSPVNLEVVSSKAMLRSEEKLWKVGHETAEAFYIYQLAGDEKSSLWVKSAPGRYYEVKLAAP